MKYLSIVCCLFFSISASAKIVGRVIDVKGNAFSFFSKKATTLKYGSKIEDLTEVMVEDGSMLSVVNPEGHVFHINGGSLVKFYKGMVELKNGFVWVKSDTKSKGLITSSNSIGSFTEGQFIYAFDNISGKTQLLVLIGDVKFSNALEPNLKTNVAAGFFSLVDLNYENGLPRSPTKVGLTSYKKMKNVFVGFESLQDTKLEKAIWGGAPAKASRGIASVGEKITAGSVPTNMSSSAKKGKLIKITTYGGDRAPASVTGSQDSPFNYYMDIQKKNAWKNKPLKTSKSVKVRYFGGKYHGKGMSSSSSYMPTKMSKASRVPASIGRSGIINELKTSEFERSLQRESQKTKRHSNEVNNLIDELKSYKQDYRKNY